MQILKIAEFECSSCFLAVFSPNLHEDILLLCIGGLVHVDSWVAGVLRLHLSLWH